MAATEALAVSFGVAYVLLAIRQRRACWIAGGASAALYIVVFLDAGLPLQAVLQVLYVALSVYGWIRWRPDGAAPAMPETWPPSRHLLALAAVGIATAASTALLANRSWSAAPFADSLGTWTSVVATWMLARRFIETWLWWIVIDVGLAALFANQGLPFTAALYLAYAVLAVAGWRAWRGSRVADDAARIAAVAVELGMHRPDVTPLEGGLVNRAWRLRDAGRDVVLRLAGGQSGMLGADLESERTMQELAARLGLAPAILVARPAEGLLVTHHAAGHGLRREDFHDEAMLRRIGSWIAHLHCAPPPPLPAVDIGARAAAYLKTMEAGDAAPAAARIARTLAARRAALPPPDRLAPCHHDLHHRNFVDATDGLLAVDWEYAGPGDPAADLASCIGYHALGPREVDALLAGYDRDDAALRARLAALGWIFDCLCYGWNGAARTAGLVIDDREQERLAERLLR